MSGGDVDDLLRLIREQRSNTEDAIQKISADGETIEYLLAAIRYQNDELETMVRDLIDIP